MRVSGFTIVRDVVRLGYPFQQSLRSLLPLVDELVVSVGDGDDGTWEAVAAIGDPKITAFRSAWGAPTAGGEVLSQQTNAALARCRGDWAIYLQADEVLHEQDYAPLVAAMRRHLDTDVEGLLFRYHHFWQHPAIEADCYISFYPHAVRAVRLGRGVTSSGDAAGFSVHGRGVIKAHSGASVFHYGWCQPREALAARLNNLRGWYAAEDPLSLTGQDMYWPLPVRSFGGSHPAVMREWVDAREPWSGPAPPTRSTAARRALMAAVRSPRSVSGWARPLLPVTLTNLWWRTGDLRRGRRT